MENAGHECVAFCEIDKFARASYKAIHDTEGEIELHDITQVTDDEIRNIGHVDAICGGFPCQAFSIAGNRRGFEDTRGTLFFEIARFASILKPKYLFLENVKGLLNHDKGDTFEVILSALDELGYDVEWQVLNSKYFGVPQNRERVFIIGHLRGERGRKIFPIGGKNEKSSAERLGINILGNTKNPNGTAQGTRDIVHDPKGIVGTLTATDYKGPKQVAIPVLTPDRANKRQNGRRFKTDGVNGISPTLNTMQGGDRQPKIRVREATKQGYAEASVGDSVNLAHPNSKTTRPVLEKANAGLPEELFKRFQEEVEGLRKEHPNNLNNYIREVKGCDQKNANRTQNALNLCYAEKAALTPLKAVQMEGMLSRELFSEIIDYVFNNYEWSERLDNEVDRIILKYRTKGKVGRNKTSVRNALYTAYALGV